MTDYRRLDALFEAVTVDCYNDAKRATAFLTAFTEDSRFPASASPVDIAVTVVGVDIDQDGVSLLPDVSAGRPNDGSHSSTSSSSTSSSRGDRRAWLDAAYRRDRGLIPYPHQMPVG